MTEPNSSYVRPDEQLVIAVNVLSEIEWSYPPADAIKPAGRKFPEAWMGPARCPVCFAEANPKGIHKASCQLVRALRG